MDLSAAKLYNSRRMNSAIPGKILYLWEIYHRRYREKVANRSTDPQ
ncbi:hypothetical protein M069_0755 [Bacteroides fragilis str. B1 (UDC16-1)]|nr:hypothetical protein M120_0557 [Bacteroides fragilis str. 3783N1-8]EXZ84736.1 hypothetical protein M069_0755 [Bacteroides fragilis str. B1 (UDC16-1)]